MVMAKKMNRLKRSILEYFNVTLYFGEEREFYSASDIESGFQINKYMEPFGYANATTEGYVNANGDWSYCTSTSPDNPFC